MDYCNYYYFLKYTISYYLTFFLLLIELQNKERAQMFFKGFLFLCRCGRSEYFWLNKKISCVRSFVFFYKKRKREVNTKKKRNKIFFFLVIVVEYHNFFENFILKICVHFVVLHNSSIINSIKKSTRVTFFEIKKKFFAV